MDGHKFAEVKKQFKDNKLVVVKTVSGSLHRVKSFGMDKETFFVKTTDGVIAPLDKISDLYVCADVVQMQSCLWGNLLSVVK